LVTGKTGGGKHWSCASALLACRWDLSVLGSNDLFFPHTLVFGFTDEDELLSVAFGAFPSWDPWVPLTATTASLSDGFLVPLERAFLGVLRTTQTS
jgi:hypothetical protein